MKQKERKGIFLVFATALISGFSIFINKFGVKGINPFLFAGLKNTLVAVFLTSLIFGSKQKENLKKLTKKDWLTLFVIGLIGGSLPFLLFFKGLSLSSAAQAAFIHKNMFLLVAFLAPLLLKEKLNKNFFLAAFLLLAGNSLLFGHPFSLFWNQGSLLVFGATFLWALENIVSKKVLKRLSPKIVAWGRMTFGSLVILLLLAATGNLSPIFNLGYVHWLWVLVTSLFLFGYVFSWYSGLKYIPVSVATSILVLGSPITSLLSVLSGKTLDLKELSGAVLLIFGIVILLMIEKIRFGYARS